MAWRSHDGEVLGAAAISTSFPHNALRSHLSVALRAPAPLKGSPLRRVSTSLLQISAAVRTANGRPYDIVHKKIRLAKSKSDFFVLALPIFLCRQSIVPPAAGPDVLSIICKKSACRWQADFLCWRYLSSRAVTRKVLSAKVSLTSVFGMGTGGPSPQSTPTASKQIPYPSPRSKAQGSVTPLLLLSNAKLVLHWVLRDVP